MKVIDTLILYCSDGFVSVYIVQELSGGTLAIRAIHRVLLLSQKGCMCAQRGGWERETERGR